MISSYVKHIIIFLIFALHILPLKAQNISNFSTDLPLIIIDTQGKTIPDEPKIYARMKIINNSSGVNRFTDYANEYNGHINIEKLKNWITTRLNWLDKNMIGSCPSTSSPEWAENSGFKIYPNPATSLLNIQAASPVSGLQVYNLSGKMLLSKNALNAQVIHVDVSSFNPGIYLLKLLDGNGNSTTEKIVIK